MSDNENSENNENEEGNEIDDEDEQEKNNNNGKIGKSELISDYKDKEKIYNLIIKNNNELKNKIDLATNKYNEILKRIEEKQQTDIEYQLKTQMNSVEKELEAYQNENKIYKRKIEQLKNSVYFKNSVANSSSLKNALKQEKIKNKEYTDELNTLKRIQKFNKKLITKNESEHKIKENIKSITEQIKEIKEHIKQMNDRYNILEHYFKLVHEKIVGLDFIKIKKKKEIIESKKEEEKKSFTNQEVKDILRLIITLRNQIFEKRNKINNINSNTEDKMHKFFSQNKTIEMELKEELKIYKDLITKKNNIKKIINKLNGKIKKQKSIKKQDSIKDNSSLNNIDLDNSNNNNVINTQILKDKINSDITQNQDELINDKINDENKENKENKENNEITMYNIENNNNMEQTNEEKKILDNLNDVKEGMENNEIKENEKIDVNNIDNNNENKNIEKNENEE
jgi:hypothetical protein